MLRLQYVRNMDMVDDAVVESGGTYVKDSEYLVAVVVPIQTVIVAIVRRNKIGTSCRTCRRRKELPRFF